MGTKSEIKKALECCTIMNCIECPYKDIGCAYKNQDALMYIEMMEKKMAQMEIESKTDTDGGEQDG